MVNENGEIIDTIESMDKYTKLDDGDKIIRRRSIESFKDTVEIKYHFIKINPQFYGEIASKYSILNVLVKYIGFMDGILVYQNGKKVKMKDVYKICDVSKSTAKRQLKGLFEEDILHKIKDIEENQTYLILNPYIAFIGRRVCTSLFDEFKYSRWRSETLEYENMR